MKNEIRDLNGTWRTLWKVLGENRTGIRHNNGDREHTDINNRNYNSGLRLIVPGVVTGAVGILLFILVPWIYGLP